MSCGLWEKLRVYISFKLILLNLEQFYDSINYQMRKPIGHWLKQILHANQAYKL